MLLFEVSQNMNFFRHTVYLLFIAVVPILSNHSRADDGWYQFPTKFQGKLKIAKVVNDDKTKAERVWQEAEIVGSTMVIRTENGGSRRLRLTRVNPENDFVEIDLLETTNRGCSQWTYRCIIEISGDRMKLCIPQVDSDPRPQSFDRMGERETLFVLTREPASNKQ